MYNSLLTGLEKALTNGGSKFPPSMDSAVGSLGNLLRTLPSRSVVVSGSVIVQAMLGAVWEDSDLDIYTTASAAKYVRTWLMKEAGQVLVNVAGSSDYNGAVEKYVRRPEDGQLIMSGRDNNDSWMYDSSQFRDSEVEVDGQLIETYPRVPIHYEPRLSKNPSKIDLVVLSESDDISDAINQFDLDICQNIWDGRSFTIGNASDAFLGRANTTPLPRNFHLNSYISCVIEAMSNVSTILRTCSYGYMLLKYGNLWTEEGKEWQMISRCKTIEECLAALFPSQTWWDLTIPTERLIKTISDKRIFAPEYDADNVDHWSEDDIVLACMVNHLRCYFVKGTLPLSRNMDDVSGHNNLVPGMNRRRKYEARGVNIMHVDSTHQIPQSEHFCRILPIYETNLRWLGWLIDDDDMDLVMDEEERERHLHDEYRNDLTLHGLAYAEYADSNRKRGLKRALTRRLLSQGTNVDSNPN